MQQAIYTNAHLATPPAIAGHGTGASQKAGHNENKHNAGPSSDGALRFKRFRLLMSIVGNVLGGAILLSGMLMLPQLFVSLLAN